MITSIFKNNVISYFIVVIVSLALWCFHFWESDLSFSESFRIASNQFIVPQKQVILYSFLIFIFSGVMLNYLVRKYLFGYESNNLFLFFYAFIYSLFLPSSELLKFSLVVLGLSWVLGRLLTFTQGKKIEKKLINVGIVLGLLSLHNFLFVGLVFVVIQNIGALKRVRVREVFALLIGFLLPLAYIGIFSTLTENDSFFQSILTLDWITPIFDWKILLVLFIFTIISIKGYFVTTRRRSGIDINMLRLKRNLFVSLVVLLLIAIGSLFLFESIYSFCILTIPLSIFLASYFLNSKSRFKELVFVLIFSLTFLLR